MRAEKSRTGWFNPNVLADTHQSELTVNKMLFKTFIDKLSEQEQQRGQPFVWYMQQQAIKKLSSQLLDDIPPLTLLGRFDRLFTLALWVGQQGSISPLHFDAQNNLFVQLQGRKHFNLFSPKDSVNLYPATGQKYPHISQVNIDDPDSKKFPKLSQATRIDITLNAGDALFLPKYWCHQVNSLDDSISINHWWANPLEKIYWANVIRRYWQRFKN